MQVLAQERLVPLSSNINYWYSDLKVSSAASNEQITAKTNAVSLSIPFKDDFFYAQYSNYPNQSLWSDSSVYVNTGKPIAPLSIGVATFDGLNKLGKPYNPNLANTLSYAADTLTSRPINLLTKASQTLQVLDSIALTFYYQGRGNGDMPEPGDSLMLDFYKPLQQKWIKRVWAVAGFSNANTNDTIFKRAFIMIKDTAYLRDGFRFRFRNKAAINGDWDNWHIDYVLLDKNRSVIKDTTYDDITFGYMTLSPLKKYTTMPYKQFNSGEQEFKFTNWLRYNGNDASVNSSYGHKLYNAQNTLLHTIPIVPSDNIGRFRYGGWVNQPTLARPPLSYSFSALSDTATFRFQHYIYRNSAGGSEINLNNDTINCNLSFKNYYAFDDGAAERAYELKGTGAQLAYKVGVNVTDTLRAVRIYFDKSMTTLASSSFFRLCIWSDGGNGPGVLIYRDSLEKPKFINTGYNLVPEYKFTTPQVLSPGNYYIGLQKFTINDLVIGHDANSIKNDYLYYNTNGTFVKSAIPGALMMRFVFGKVLPDVVGIPELNLTTLKNVVQLFPNPANEKMSVRNDSELNLAFEIRNVVGQLITSGNLNESLTEISTTTFAAGIYICLIKDKSSKPIQQLRFVVQH